MSKETTDKKETKTYTDDELKAMEEDVKKSLDKEKQELVEKTISETKKRLEEEKRLKEMQEQLKKLQEEKEEEQKKYAADLEALKVSFKEESEKMLEEFRNSRQSTVDTKNPFRINQEQEADVLVKYRNDPEYQKELDAASRKAFADYLGVRERNFM